VLHVDWRDGYWMVRAGDEPALPHCWHRRGRQGARLSLQPGDLPPGAGRFRLPSGRLPPSSARGRSRRDAPRGAAPPPAPALVEGGRASAARRGGPSWPATRRKPLRPRRWCCSTSSRGLRLGPLGLCPVCGAQSSGGAAMGAAGAGLGGLLARTARGNAAGWSVVALDDASLARAEALAPQISALVPPAGDVRHSDDPGTVGEAPPRSTAGLPVPQRAGGLPAGGPAADRALADWRRCSPRSAPASGPRWWRPGPPRLPPAPARLSLTGDVLDRRFDSGEGTL